MTNEISINNTSLGQKIRTYRQRLGLSQFQLAKSLCKEDAGWISKIENGRSNPTKETIADIANALKLETNEIASLYGLYIKDIHPLIEQTTEILSSLDLLEILDKTSNDLIFKMGYLASVIFLKDGDDTIRCSALTKTNMSLKTLQFLDKPFNELYLSIKDSPDNLIVKAIKENKVYLTHNTYEYIIPIVTKEIADKMQEATGDKSNIIYPFSVNKHSFGTIVYIKKIASDFKDERRTLQVISRQIAIAIHNATKLNNQKNRDN